MKKILLLVLIVCIFTHFHMESYATASPAPFASELYAYYHKLFGQWFGLEEKDDEAFGLTQEQLAELENDKLTAEEVSQAYGDEGVSIITQNPYVLKGALNLMDSTMKAKEHQNFLADQLNKALKESGRSPYSPDATLEEMAADLAAFSDKIFVPVQFNTDHLKKNLNDFVSKELDMDAFLLGYDFYKKTVSSHSWGIAVEHQALSAAVYDEEKQVYRIKWKRRIEYHWRDKPMTVPVDDVVELAYSDFEYREYLKHMQKEYFNVSHMSDDKKKQLSKRLAVMIDTLEKQKDQKFGISLSAIQKKRIGPGDVVLFPPSTKPAFRQREDGTMSVPDVLPRPLDKDKTVPLIPPLTNPITDTMQKEFPGLPKVLPPSSIPDVLPGVNIPGVTDISKPIPNTDVLDIPIPKPSDLPFIGPIIDLIKAILALLKWIVGWLRDFLLNLLKMFLNAMLSLFVPRVGFLEIIYNKLRLGFGDVQPYVKALEPLLKSSSNREFEDLFVNMYGARIKILDGQFVRQNINFYHKLVRAFMFPLIIIFNLRKLQGVLNGSGQSDIAGAQGNLTGSAAEVKS